MDWRERLPEPPLGGSEGDQGIAALFLLMLALFLAVGLALYLSAGMLLSI